MKKFIGFLLLVSTISFAANEYKQPSPSIFYSTIQALGTITPRTSTTSSSTAPIKIPNGLLMATAEVGAIEFDGTNLYYTDSTPTRKTIATMGGGTGTVTSIDTTVPAALLTVSGVPITTSGTIAISLATQISNTIFSGPTSGGSATPTFRSMVTNDISTAIVTNAKLATMADQTVKANVSGGVASPTDVGLVSTNTALTAVYRDVSGNFSAGTITASLTGHSSLDVLKSGDTMSGTLLLRASTTVAGTSPLKFPTGALMATAEAGAIEYDGTNLFYTTAGAVRKAIATAVAGSLASSRNVVTDSSGNLTTQSTTSTETGYLSGIANTNGTVIYGNGASLVNSSAGTSGQVFTSGGVGAPSWTTATDSNTVSSIVKRDGSGNFTAGTITASLIGSASLNVLKSGDTMSGTLLVRASTSASGTTPIKIQTGVLMNTAEVGAIEFDGTNLYYTDSTPTRKTLSIGTSTVTANRAVASNGSGNFVASTTTATELGYLSGLTVTNGGVVYGNGASLLNSGAGTSGQVLTSGGAGTPTWTTATDANTVSTIVKRDASGNFTAGTITASLTGAASLNVLKSGDTMSGTLLTRASTTVAGTAPLKINLGVLMATAEAGAIEYDGTNLFYTTAGSVRKTLATSTSGVLTASKNLVTDSSGNITTQTTTSTETGYLAGIANTNGTVIYGNGTSLVNSSAGTSGQVFTSGGVGAPSWTTATDSNTASAIVKRDASGNFTAGTITASLIGHSSLDLALTGGTMTGQIIGSASTTVSNTAPIKLQVGVLQSTAQSGAIEYDGTSLYYTDATPSRKTLLTTASASQWITTGSNIYYNTGSVGVGTTAPLATLNAKSAPVDKKGQLSLEDPTAAGSSVSSAAFITGYGNNSAAGTSTGRKWVLGNTGSGIDNDVYLTNSNATNVILGGANKTLVVDTANDRVGIGNTAPTAKLHLGASTTLASSAPIKLATGVLMSTAEAGAIEYDGTNLFYTNAGATRLTIATGTGTTITANRAAASDGSGNLVASATTATELGYLSGIANTSGGLVYGNGATLKTSTAGTSGQLLTSGGTGAPTWTTSTDANTASAVVQRDASGNFTAATITHTGQMIGRASTTANGTAPIKLATGILQTTAQAGNIEYDGTNLYFTDAVPTRRTMAIVGTDLPLAGGTMTGQIVGRASTTVAGTAPIKLQTGVLMATAASGSIEFDGTNLYYTDSTPTRKTLSTGGAASFPTHATMWHDEDIILTGTSSYTANVAGFGRPYSEFYQGSPANGDSFQQTCFMAAGTYTFYVRGEAAGDRGKIDWYLNGSTFITGQDWNSGSGDLVKTGSITISTSGVQTIKGVINGTNGSNYYMSLAKMWIE